MMRHIPLGLLKQDRFMRDIGQQLDTFEKQELERRAEDRKEREALVRVVLERAEERVDTRH